ncbi:MAG TPA: hypothetical protein VGM03_11710 [Phycisphaerae bacterium]
MQRKGRRTYPTRVLAFGTLFAAMGCTQPWGWNRQTPQQPPATASAAPSAAPEESLYADPLALESPVTSRARASEQEVRAFLERLPKPGDAAPEPSETGPGAAVPNRAVHARSNESPPQAAGAAGEPEKRETGRPGEPRDESSVAANMAAQISTSTPVTRTDAATASPVPKTAPKLESLLIRAPARGGDASGRYDAAPSTSANAALSTDPQRERTVDETIEFWRQRVVEKPDDSDALWRMRTLLLAMGREQEALATPPGSADSSADLLMAALRAAATLRRASQAPASATDDALHEIETVREKLRHSAELAIPGVALCSRVTAFGVYDELPGGTFVAGGTNRAIVYCEIHNFASEKTDGDRYRTLLSSRLELLLPDGRSIWQKEEPQIEDLSRRRREDFFLAQKITLPANLSAGEYVLKVTICDRLAQKTNETMQTLKVAPSGSASR